MQGALVRTCLTAVAACALTAASASADTITLDSGTATVTWPGGGRIVRMSATGPDASIDAAWSTAIVGPQQQCALGCAPGELLNLSTTVFSDTPQTPPVENSAVGSATLNGVTFSGIAYTGALTFAALPVVLPPTTVAGDALAVWITSTFTLSGELSGYQVLNTRDPILLFTEPFTGNGTVTTPALINPNSGTYSFGPMTYTFGEVAPTPEPATLLLMGLGLFAAAAARRRLFARR